MNQDLKRLVYEVIKTSRTKGVPRTDQVLGIKGILRRELGPQDASRGRSQDLRMHLEEGVRISRHRTPQKRGRGTSKIKGTSKSYIPWRRVSTPWRCGRLEERVRISRATGVLRRETGPQDASRGGKQELENERDFEELEDKRALREELEPQRQA